MTDGLFLLVNLLFTVLVEGGVMALGFRRWDFVYFSLLCNLLTNPMANLLLLAAVKAWGPGVYGAALAGIESAVTAAEAVALARLCRFTPVRAALVSVALNGASLLAGFLWGVLSGGW